MDTVIWIFITIVSVVIFILSLLISVTAFHKKFIANLLKKNKSIGI